MAFSKMIQIRQVIPSKYYFELRLFEKFPKRCTQKTRKTNFVRPFCYILGLNFAQTDLSSMKRTVFTAVASAFFDRISLRAFLQVHICSKYCIYTDRLHSIFIYKIFGFFPFQSCSGSTSCRSSTSFRGSTSCRYSIKASESPRDHWMFQYIFQKVTTDKQVPEDLSN